jgi:hypothetical protein
MMVLNRIGKIEVKLMKADFEYIVANMCIAQAFSRKDQENYFISSLSCPIINQNTNDEKVDSSAIEVENRG